MREGKIPARLGQPAGDTRADTDGAADARHQRDRPGGIEQRLLSDGRHKAQSFGLLRGHRNPISSIPMSCHARVFTPRWSYSHPRAAVSYRSPFG
ncbi:hypothetical protein [Streptomyces vulcanius]|uniref:hypothetical protein n=1 Tax=Streptomyces vulcanius TaxID=1441876 RepID=UPI0036DD7F41